MREKCVNVIVDATWKKIFERRDEYLTKCYPDRYSFIHTKAHKHTNIVCFLFVNRIIILRHGESYANVHESILSDIPDHQIPLTENGISQAIRAGIRIKAICGDDPIYCYYSPYMRAKETLDNVMIGGHLDLQVFTKLEDPRLIEQKFGNKQSHENMKMEKNMRLEYSRYFYQFKYGESGLDVNLRATAFVDRLFDHFRTGYYATKPDVHWNVLIVSHGLFMRVFLKAFLRCTINEFSTWYNYANCEMCVLIKQTDGSYLVCESTPLPTTPRNRDKMND